MEDPSSRRSHDESEQPRPVDHNEASGRYMFVVGSAGLSARNQQMRLALQERLLREETEAVIDTHIEARGVPESDEVNVAMEFGELMTSLPSWSYYAALLLLIYDAVFLAQSPPPGHEAGSRRTSGLLDCPSFFLPLMIGMLQRVLEEALGPSREKDRARLHQVISDFDNDLVSGLSKASGGDAQTFRWQVDACRSWLAKIRTTPEAMIRPGHVADRLERLRRAVLPGNQVASLSGTAAAGQGMTLFETFLGLGTSGDANCIDNAIEALADMEAAVDRTRLGQLPPERFLSEMRIAFSDELLKECAGEISRTDPHLANDKLGTYLALRSLLCEELGLNTQNTYMRFRAALPLAGEQIEQVLQTVKKRDTDDEFAAFLAGQRFPHRHDIAEDFDGFLKKHYPVYAEWHEALAEFYGGRFYEAARVVSDSERIDRTTALTAQMKKDREAVIYNYARVILQNHADPLDDLERQLKKAFLQPSST